jgi:hypothetical protein
MRRAYFFRSCGYVWPTTAAMAQDAMKVDPEHYKVEVDNDQVRVLRWHAAPGVTSRRLRLNVTGFIFPRGAAGLSGFR